MSETWKRRVRIGFRAVEIILAVALLAVLVELLLVLLNAPGPVPEIRIVRSRGMHEEPPPPALVAATLPPAPEIRAPEPAPVPPAPPPRRPQPPVLLDFENLRRLLGGTKGAPANNGGAPSGGGGGGANQAGGFTSRSPSPTLIVAPMLVPTTNAPPDTNAPPSEQERPSERPKETNQVSTASSNTEGGNNSPVFRISVP